MAGDELRGELGPRELQALRADVLAHVATLQSGDRRRLRETVDATIERIDARLAQLRAERPAGDDDVPDVVV